MSGQTKDSATLAVRFVAGRYHGTPWGRHVNEGSPDWPPAPWRILRALVASWHNRAPEIPRDLVEALMRKLVARPPEYKLPDTDGVRAHTRHYMPGPPAAKASDEAHKRVMVIDGFVRVPDSSELFVQWPQVNLSRQERECLGVLAERLTYLGRAESWCEAHVQDDPVVPDYVPFDTSGKEPQRLLTPSASATLEDLEQTVAAMRKARASLPVNAEWVSYSEVRAASTRPPTQDQGFEDPHAPTLALLSFGSKPLPQLQRTIQIADVLRSALMGKSKRLNKAEEDQVNPVFSGRKGDGPSQAHHQHAHYFPFDSNGDGRIDHAWVWAPGGFDANATASMGSLSTLYDNRDLELRTALVGLARPEDWRDQSRIGASAVWRSATPYFLARYPHKRRDSAESQIRRELELRKMPNPVEVRVEPGQRIPLRNGRDLASTAFRAFRGRHRPAIPQGHVVTLTFEAPILGPIALGFGSHFGLGAFEALETKT